MKFEVPKETIEKIRLLSQPMPDVSEVGKKFREAANAQIGLPEKIDRLTGEVGKLVVVANAQIEIAKAQKQLAEEAGKQAEDLSKQTDRLVDETVTLARFTKRLFWFTVILVGFAIIQIVIMLFDYFSKKH